MLPAAGADEGGVRGRVHEGGVREGAGRRGAAEPGRIVAGSGGQKRKVRGNRFVCSFICKI